MISTLLLAQILTTFAFASSENAVVMPDVAPSRVVDLGAIQLQLNPCPLDQLPVGDRGCESATFAKARSNQSLHGIKGHLNADLIFEAFPADAP